MLRLIFNRNSRFEPLARALYTSFALLRKESAAALPPFRQPLGRHAFSSGRFLSARPCQPKPQALWNSFCAYKLRLELVRSDGLKAAASLQGFSPCRERPVRHSRPQPGISPFSNELVIMQGRIRAIYPIDFSLLARAQSFPRVQAPNTFEKPLPPEHFV